MKACRHSATEISKILRNYGRFYSLVGSHSLSSLSPLPHERMRKLGMRYHERATFMKDLRVRPKLTYTASRTNSFCA